MHDNKMTNLSNKYQENEFCIPESRKARIIQCIILTTIYIVLHLVQVKLGQMSTNNIQIFGIDIIKSPLLVMISQIHISIVILLIIYERKLGYIIDWIIVSLVLIGDINGAVCGRSIVALQGIFSQVFSIILMIIVYRYTHLFEMKYQEVIKQREEILALYSEIAASESVLMEQKSQLEGFNTILEEREEELNQLAFYDPLTSLPNRRMIIDRIDAMIQISIKEKREFAIVFFDLDNFKKINDTVGHQMGDELLLQVVNRWNKIIDKKDLFGRMGGDEFAIIIQRSMEQDEILRYIEKIREALNESVYYKQREFYIKASFGISMFPQDGSSSEYLLKYADIAMYQSKNSTSKKIHFFNRELQEKFQHNVLLENYMQQVLIRNELSIVFQPQYESITGKLRGFEALARWITKKIGLISPKEFIPIAEENGMIISIGEWILRESCKTCKQWMDICNRKFSISVNVSAVQLLDTGFLNMVDRVLRETRLDPTCLEVEVTESVFISSMESAIDALSELKERGITIALDDFGTGYASLSYLQSLPIDTIKIDKSFIDGILTEKKQKALVKSLIAISHELSLKVIAEGVEQQMQLEFLADANCDYIQGYLLGKPKDAEIAFEIVKTSD